MSKYLIVEEACDRCGSNERYKLDGRCRGCRAIWNENYRAANPSLRQQWQAAMAQKLREAEERAKWVKPEISKCSCYIDPRFTIRCPDNHLMFKNRDYDKYCYYGEFELCPICETDEVNELIDKGIIRVERYVERMEREREYFGE